MIKVHKSITIAAPPGEVWAILGDLSRAAEYVPGVVSARANGMQRVCKDESGNEIREEMSDYSPELRQYSFRHVQVPLPVRDSRGSFHVRADGAASIAEMTWELEPLEVAAEPQLAAMIEGAAQMTLENLRQRAEARA